MILKLPLFCAALPSLVGLAVGVRTVGGVGAQGGAHGVQLFCTAGVVLTMKLQAMKRPSTMNRNMEPLLVMTSAKPSP